MSATLTPDDYIKAARVPASIKAQTFGLWEVYRRKAPHRFIGFPTQTLLCRWTSATMHLTHGEIVMDDSRIELVRHLPIWLAARGRVLKTGLGMGCVVRGLLLKDEVEHIDVVEIDADIIRVFGAEFVGNPRVTIHHADAHQWDYGSRHWDFIWHDIHDNFEKEHLAVQHTRLIARYIEATPVERQGAWMFPRIAKRKVGVMLGAAKY